MSSEAFESGWLQKLNDPLTHKEAVERIYQAYVEQLLQRIREMLSVRLNGRVDPDDIAQSVFRSFYAGRFEIINREALFALLVRIALNKTKEANRFHSAQKRNVELEVSLDDSAVREQLHKDGRRPAVSQRWPERDSVSTFEQGDTDVCSNSPQEDGLQFDDATLALLTRGATAEQAAVTIELFESIPPDHQVILNMRIEGMTEPEIALKLGCTRRTVTRRLYLIRKHFLIQLQKNSE